MARGQNKRDSRRQCNTAQSKMLQAVLLGAVMGSTSAFVAPLRPASLGGAGSRPHAALSSVAQMAHLGRATRLSQLGLGAASPATSKRAGAALQMVAAGVERGMFTTSRPEDRRVTPEFRDGKAHFKVCCWVVQICCRCRYSQCVRFDTTFTKGIFCVCCAYISCACCRVRVNQR